MNYIFDLDGTLYDAKLLFAQMNHMSTEYLSELLHIGSEEAHRLLRHYLDTYGSLANGLSYHHDVEFDTFFDRQYQLDVLLPLVPKHPDLQRIRLLDGPKFILSNAPQVWVHAVLKHLDIADVFTAVYCCDDFDHKIKPQHHPYLTLCANHGIEPGDCMFFDDTIGNVQAALDLGMYAYHVSVDGKPATLPPEHMVYIRGLPVPKVQP